MSLRLMAAIAALSFTCAGEVPPGWTLAGSKPADYDTGVDPVAVYNGTPSAYLKSNKPAISGFGTLMQYIKPDEYAGKRLRFSAFVKTEAVQDWAGLWMRVDGDKAKGEMLAFDNMQSRGIKGTTAWQRYEVVLNVAQGATGIGFGILLGGTGAAWINGAKLEVVGAEVPTTEMKFQSPDQPVNLDLEGGPSGAPRGWTLGNQSGYETGVDPQAAYGGRNSAVLKAKTPGGNDFGTLMQYIKADKYRGKRIRLSAFARTEGADGWSGLWMRVDGPQRAMLAFDNMQSRPLKGTTVWQNCAVVLDVAPEAAGIAFGVLLSGGGSAWINGVKLEVVGEEVPVTRMEMPQTAAGPANLQLEGEPGAPPRGWFMAGSKPRSYTCGVEMESGRPGAYLKSKEPAIDGFGTLMQMFRAEQYLGKRIRLSALVRAEAVENWAGLWMRVDKGKDSIAFDNMGDRPIKGTSAWQSYAVVLDVGQDATRIAFGILLTGTGSVWMTDVKFEVVGTEIPTTGRKLPPGPTNLGFEK